MFCQRQLHPVPLQRFQKKPIRNGLELPLGIFLPLRLACDERWDFESAHREWQARFPGSQPA